MSALIKNDIMVQSKMRMLAEYAVNGAYYDDHPDYALYMTTIGEAKELLHKFTDAGTTRQPVLRPKRTLQI